MGKKEREWKRTMTVRKITTTCSPPPSSLCVQCSRLLVRTNFSRRKTSLKIIDIFLVRRRANEWGRMMCVVAAYTRVSQSVKSSFVGSFFVVSTILGWLVIVVAVFHLIIYVHYICKWNAEIYVVVPWWNYNMWMFYAVDA